MNTQNGDKQSWFNAYPARPGAKTSSGKPVVYRNASVQFPSGEELKIDQIFAVGETEDGRMRIVGYFNPPEGMRAADRIRLRNLPKNGEKVPVAKLDNGEFRTCRPGVLQGVEVPADENKENQPEWRCEAVSFTNETARFGVWEAQGQSNDGGKPYTYANGKVEAADLERSWEDKTPDLPLDHAKIASTAAEQDEDQTH